MTADDGTASIPAPSQTHRERVGVSVVMFATVSVLTLVGVIGAFQVRRQAETVTIRVATGVGIFEDEQVKRLLREQSITVTAVAFGSKELPPAAGARYDALVSASATAVASVTDAHPQFPISQFSYSPLVVITTEPYLPVLRQRRIARAAADGVMLFDVKNYVDTVNQGYYWNGTTTPDDSADPVGKAPLLLTTSDPRRSSSGEAFISSASVALNHHRMVTELAQVTDIARSIQPCFRQQGWLERKTPDVLNKITRADPAAMVLVYENDYRVALANHRLPADVVVLYPTPNVMADNTLIALNERGEKLGSILMAPEVQRMLRDKFGYRINNSPESPFLARGFAITRSLAPTIMDAFIHDVVPPGATTSGAATPSASPPP